MTASISRNFEGVSSIVRFNFGYYGGSAAALGVLILLLSRHLPWWLRAAVYCGGAGLAFWTCSSLLVSWYVYDVIGVTRWEWICGRLPFAPRRWVNVHAGLDQSTASLRRLFPDSEGEVIDIYEAEKMTEPSIARARKLHPATEPFKLGNASRLPLPDAGRDAVFLLFAAHEVRALGGRTELLGEAARVVEKQGQVVLVEHLRDMPNFLAFGPGFLHFHSRRSWRGSIQKAGLRIEQQTRVTPFVCCFILRKADA